MPACRGAAPGSVVFVPFQRVWQAPQDVLSYPCVELLSADLAQHSKASTSTHKDAEGPSPSTLAQILSSRRHLSSDPRRPPQLTSRGDEGLSYCPVGHSQVLPRGLAEGERAEPSSGLHRTCRAPHALLRTETLPTGLWAYLKDGRMLS